MSSNEEQMYPADRPVRAWRRVRDENGDFVSDVAFAVGQTWEDEVPRWFNVSMVNVDGRTTVESSKLLPEGTSEDDLRANGYYRETVGGMLNFVQTLARWVEEAEDRAADNYTMAFGAKARLNEFRKSFNETYQELLDLKKELSGLKKESEQVGALKNALNDAIGTLVGEFCMMSNQVDGDGVRRKVFYVPATEVEVYRLAEGNEGDTFTWDKHEFEYDTRVGTWVFKDVTVVEGKTRDDLRALGARETSMTDWLVQGYHTAKDLKSAHVEIKDLREKIQRLLDADSRKAGERAVKAMQEFVWVNYWTSDEGTDDATEFQDVYWSRTDFEAEMIAAGSRDKPLSWFRVGMQRPHRPGAQWKVMGSEAVNLLSVEKLEEYGAKAFPASQARVWMRMWSQEVLDERSKASHPSQGPADVYLRAEKAEADVAYWKAKAEEAEAREKALEAKHKNDMEALVADAHQWADENELCSAFDEFMEEHGLPARLRDWTVKVEVPITLEFTVEDMSNADDARAEAERYVEQEIRSLNDIAGMDDTARGPRTAGRGPTWSTQGSRSRTPPGRPTRSTTGERP